MTEQTDKLTIEVRAATDGFRADIDKMRSTLDTNLVDGFARAGKVLEHGLFSAIRRGSLGFDDLKRTAFQTLNEIAAQALHSGLANLFGHGGGSGGGIGGLLSNLAGSLLGLPGRATGGPVAANRPYLVGERGPELFVPTAAGRVEAGATQGGGSRKVSVAINLTAPRGTDVPVALRRSSRQVASSVRRALQQF